MASVIDAFEAAKPQLDETMRKGAIQADFNDANVIVGKDDQLGVIDFGDIVHTWVINEVAIGCAYATVSSYGKVGLHMVARQCRAHARMHVRRTHVHTHAHTHTHTHARARRRGHSVSREIY